MISFYPLPSKALGITGFLGFFREIVQRKLKNDDKTAQVGKFRNSLNFTSWAVLRAKACEVCHT